MFKLHSAQNLTCRYQAATLRVNTAEWTASGALFRCQTSPVPFALQLATDDSFQFNRTVGVIKQHVKGLPKATADDDAIMSALQVGPGDQESCSGGAPSHIHVCLENLRPGLWQAVLSARYADAHAVRMRAGKVTCRGQWSSASAGSGTST
jgi:hypothetical protein